MTTPKIESGVPNYKTSHYQQPVKWPFESLEIDDSFFVAETEELPQRKLQVKMASAAVYWRKKLNRKFTCRQVDGGVRIWRTE